MKLKGTVAVVTGASRGVGRGIALELGAAGATVYVTGRSVAGNPTVDQMPGTIDETAALVSQMGGIGIGVRCDHTNETDVRSLFEQISQEQGRLDVLVNNVWGGYEGYDPIADKPFWLHPDLPRWPRMFTAGVFAHYLTSCVAVPLMIAQRRGLIIAISAGDTSVGEHRVYLGQLMYDVAKTSIDRLSQGMAHELRSFGIASLTVYPGFVATERVLAAFAGVAPEVLRKHGPRETPHYVGRAVVALASDPAIMRFSGHVLMVGHLARIYGFTDIDGSQPEPFQLPDSYRMEREGDTSGIASEFTVGDA